MSKEIYLVMACLLTLTGCSKPETTAEEKVLAEVFVSMVGAETYDQMCNEGKITKMPPTKDINIYWHGNQQVIVSMMAPSLKRRNPHNSAEDIVKKLLDIRETIAEKAKVHINKNGCIAPDVVALGKSMDLYIKVPPWTLQSMITKRITEMGGTVTVLTDEENKISNDTRKAK